MTTFSALTPIEKQLAKRISLVGFSVALGMFTGLLLINGHLTSSLLVAFGITVSALEAFSQLEMFLSNLLFVWPALFLAMLLCFMALNVDYTLKIQNILNKVNPFDDASVFSSFEEACMLRKKQTTLNGLLALPLLGFALAALFNGVFKEINDIQADLAYSTFCVVSGLLTLVLMCSGLLVRVIFGASGAPKNLMKLDSSGDSFAHQISSHLSLGATPLNSSMDELSAFILGRFISMNPSRADKLCEIAKMLKN